MSESSKLSIAVQHGTKLFHDTRLPRPVEISGRQNWANVGNLAHFAQKATKKQQMLKNDVF